jgi:uncharacterized protein (TIGR03032 family)
MMRDGRPVFVNTLYSCLATVDEKHSFAPLWHPRFISRLAAEDRCHMNGLAMDGDGKPRYVSVVAASDVADGWREHRQTGGLIIDIPSGEVVAHGLSMPHSPRLHRGVLNMLNSGTGEFGRVDLASGRFESMAFCPGFLRGMSLIGDFALVGLLLPREKRTFKGLALDAALSSRGAEPRSGVMVIDLRTGDAVHWFRFEGEVKEIYDIAIIPGRRAPAAVGFLGPDIGNVISMGDMADFNP